MNSPASVNAPITVRPFPVDGFAPPIPALPKLKRPSLTSLTSHRHQANPALAMNLLQDIQQMVEQWQAELRQIVLAIQALYMEGPLVDGWLESHTPGGAGGSQIGGSQSHHQATDTAVLRYGDPEQLMNYVKDICQAQPISPQVSHIRQAADSPATGSHYRLCSLDKEGRLQCQPCPSDQLVMISMAIARYQKLRQFLKQKQYLETRLNQTVETLTSARNDLRAGSEES